MNPETMCAIEALNAAGWCLRFDKYPHSGWTLCASDYSGVTYADGSSWLSAPQAHTFAQGLAALQAAIAAETERRLRQGDRWEVLREYWVTMPDGEPERDWERMSEFPTYQQAREDADRRTAQAGTVADRFFATRIPAAAAADPFEPED